MKLTVKNFGPIKSAKVDIKPMTVFVGHSNTGKSYLAILIYSILNILGLRYEHLLWYFAHALDEKVNKKTSANLDDYMDEKKMFIQLGEVFFEWARTISYLWEKQMVYCFGEEGKSMMEKDNVAIGISDSEGKLILNLVSPEKSSLVSEEKQKMVDWMQNDERFLNTLNMEKNRVEQRDPKKIDGRFLRPQFELSFREEITQKFFSILFPQQGEAENVGIGTHYLPAIRGGIMQSHRTLVRALIGRAPMAGLDEISPIPLFSGVLSDFMKKLISVEGGSRHSTRFRRAGNGKQMRIRRISREIEKRIMEGVINVRKSDVNYPDFRYLFESGDQKYDLPLMSASSMVSELASVSLFIRHYVNHGDLFILEEPEAHLHPAAQRDMSNILVQLVNAGVHVLITTHSEYVLEQISNYVHASKIKGKINKQALDAEKISVYLFNRPKRSKQKNTIVKKIPFDPNTGILTPDHLEVSSALYNETVDILNRRKNND